MLVPFQPIFSMRAILSLMLVFGEASMQALEIYKGQMVNRMAGLDYKSRRVQRLTDVLTRAGSPGCGLDCPHGREAGSVQHAGRG
jgi:hypothetical protein